MRTIAVLTMFVAWLLYGAMPALANCPICRSEVAAPLAVAHEHGEMAGASAMADHATKQPHGDDRNANPCAGDMAHVPFCAACLAMPPTLVAEAGNALGFSYPAPTSSEPLRALPRAPPPPPPRIL